MTRDELVERVARAICKAVGDEPDSDIGLPGFEKLPNWTDWTNEASAAVDVVLEEAARIAHEEWFYGTPAIEISDAIRALKSGESNE